MSEQFRFSDDAVPPDSPERKTVGQVMRPTTTIEPGAHLAAAAYLIKHFHDAGLVVLDADTEEPLAAITDADLTRAMADSRDVENTRISQVVTETQLTVRADLGTDDAARLMLSVGVDCLPVVEGERIIGIVELADVSPASPTPAPVATARGAP
jgi:CBS domain-containing protein